MRADDPLRQHERGTLIGALVEEGSIRTTLVRDAFLEVPRHRFVPSEYQTEAYQNCALPIGYGQTISQPSMVAVMTELVRPGPARRVLEIGTGSGYQAALLARICGQVYSIERIPELHRRAEALFRELGYSNIICRLDDGTLGWPEESPFDDIMVTAGAPDVPPSLKQQVGEGGGVIIPVGDGYFQTLFRVVRRGDGIVTENHGGCIFVRLVGQEGWKSEG